jgi:1-acyl-sn-glycerol-3-phosphate acyltransferase
MNQDSSRIPWVYDIAQSFFMASIHALRIDYEGLENIPESGAFIMAANHLSHIDPPLIGGAVRRIIAPFARDTLFNFGPLGWFLTSTGCIPIKRDADSDVSGLKKTLRALQNGLAVLIYPEGTRSETGHLQPAKPGVGLIACKTRVPVIPIRFFDIDKIAFGKSGKVDLCQRVTVRFGKAICAEEYDPGKNDSDRYQTAADRIMQHISLLKPVIERGI